MQAMIEKEISDCRKRIKYELQIKIRRVKADYQQICGKLTELEWKKMSIETQIADNIKKTGIKSCDSSEQLGKIKEEIMRLKNQVQISHTKLNTKMSMIMDDQQYLTRLKVSEKGKQTRINELGERFRQIQERNNLLVIQQSNLLRSQLSGTTLEDVMKDKLAQVNFLKYTRNQKQKKLNNLKNDIMDVKQQINISNMEFQSLKATNVFHLENQVDQKEVEKKRVLREIEKCKYEFEQEGKRGYELSVKKGILSERINALISKIARYRDRIQEYAQSKDNYFREQRKLHEDFKNFKIYAMIEVQHSNKVLEENYEGIIK